jgi:hypothetical protein
MFTVDFRKPYREAWNRLFGLVKLRNQRLQHLNSMAAPAMSITLAASMIYEFNTDLARELLNEIDDLTPQIKAGIEEVNGYVDKIGTPEIRWQTLPVNWGM